jgi:hypothetical protein
MKNTQRRIHVVASWQPTRRFGPSTAMLSVPVVCNGAYFSNKYFRNTVRNKQFEAKQTDWMLTRSITRALQTRIPILGSETRCARHYLACLVTLGLVLVLRLAPRKRYLVMILKLIGGVHKRQRLLPSVTPERHSQHQSLGINCGLSGGWRDTYISLNDHQSTSVLLDIATSLYVSYWNTTRTTRVTLYSIL